MRGRAGQPKWPRNRFVRPRTFFRPHINIDAFAVVKELREREGECSRRRRNFQPIADLATVTDTFMSQW